MSIQTEAVQARELHNEIEGLVRLQVSSDIHLASKLYEIKETGLYKKAVGEGINTWVDYLRQPEINITPHRANKLVKMYEHFVVGLGYEIDVLDGVPLYALSYIADKGFNDVDAIDDLFDDARHLTEKDFKEKYHDEVDGGQRTYTFLIMKKCVETGSMEKVHNIKSEDIISAFNLQ